MSKKEIGQVRVMSPFKLNYDLKSDNLQCIMLGRWVDPLSDQASNGLSIILID